MIIIQVAIAIPLRQVFDYLAPENYTGELLPGQRVKIPFRNKETIGMIVKVNTSSQLELSQLKKISAVIDTKPILPTSLLELAHFASEYYHHSLGEVLFAALPTQLRKGAALNEENIINNDVRATHTLTLNKMQQNAVNSVLEKQNEFNCFLLEGVTGSGKTEVYLEIIAKIIQAGKQALVLVPEIGLTPQLLARFQSRFNLPIALLHSSLKESERLKSWSQAYSGQAKIIIGTRSAIFTPLPFPGIIIIDEEHDASFKQQDGFRYSARDLAIVRAQMQSIPIVLGSATPSLESLYNVKRKRYFSLKLPHRVGNAILPQYHLIDLRNQSIEHGLSTPLLQHMEKHLKNGDQTLLFINRRGYAPSLICHACGWIANCNRCDAHMTLHFDPAYLHCHHCTASRSIDKACPQCTNTQLVPTGAGTERLEIALKTHFPEHIITRIDRDTTRRKNALQTMLNKIHDGESQILIGTQMLAKGHHFPNVTFVGILNIDSGLLSADFRAIEKSAQLLIQVAGRAGRAEKSGEIAIQTYHPHHPLLQQLITEGYDAFAHTALYERHAASLPPISYMALFKAEAKKKELPLHFLNELRQYINTRQNNLTILGPAPSPMERKAGSYRAQLLLQSNKRNLLQKEIKHLIEYISQNKNSQRIRWSIDIDPIELFS